MLQNAVDEILKRFKYRNDDNVIDKLNYYRITLCLGFVAALIVLRQYVGLPIACSPPVEYAKWTGYIESYCFAENTYFVNLSDPAIPSAEVKKKNELRYYQWIPMLLMVQSVFFLIPKVYWSTMSLRTGLNVKNIARYAKYANNADDKEIDEIETKDARNSAEYLLVILRFNRIRRDFLYGYLPPSLRSRYLTIIYLVYKLMNCITTFGQLYFINTILNPSYSFLGIGILQDLLNKKTWKESGHFPRVTFCDVMIRDVAFGQPMSLTVPCVLPINMFNEVIFISFWFCFAIVGILNVGNLIQWLIRIQISEYTERFINYHLFYREIEAQPEQIKTFIHECLPTDAMTALRLLETNKGNEYVSKVVDFMFNTWLDDGLNQNEINGKSEKLKSV